MPDIEANCDICVVGSGPAGGALAVALRSLGREVVVLGSPSSGAVAGGESLPPACRPVLAALGLDGEMEADGHLPCFANESAWGTSDLQATDFLFSHWGTGWHVDRERFDRRLQQRAASTGAVLVPGARVVRVARSEDRTTLTFDQVGRVQTVRARYVADCSGRASWIARRLGVRRRVEDRLAALVLLFQEGPIARRAGAYTSLVESAAEGWWYTARIPHFRRVVVYHSDSDLASFQAARKLPGFLRLLRETRHVRPRCSGCTPLMAAPRARVASTGQLEHFTGTGWLAVGDAALSFDPLSSQGILRALQGGVAAAIALGTLLAGDGSRLASYDAALRRAREDYLEVRTRFYTRETRWPRSTFWRRRHGFVNGSVSLE